MRQLSLHVLAPHTKWGDRLFFADSSHTWNDKCELKTSAASFPWWHGAVQVPDAFDCKLYILRGHEKVWEVFKGNRKIYHTESDLTLKFDEQYWLCVVCEEYLTTKPVVCKTDCAFHQECFEPYIHTQLAKNNPDFTCMTCQADIVEDTWHNHASVAIQLRYGKAKRIRDGEVVFECPNATCSYSTFVLNSTEAILHCPDCKVTWCKFCEKQLPDGEDTCLICTEGLRSVFLDIYDAIEEAAGTMCPNCKHRGQKFLEECTHITCDCGTLFCYVCGVGKDEVDTADPYSSDINRLYGHNEDWETNADTRCPMWLSDYGSMYMNWPDDPYKCQKKFHEIKAQKKLTVVKEKTPEWNWKRVMELDKSLNMQVEKFLQKKHEVY